MTYRPPNHLSIVIGKQRTIFNIVRVTCGQMSDFVSCNFNPYSGHRKRYAIDWKKSEWFWFKTSALVHAVLHEVLTVRKTGFHFEKSRRWGRLSIQLGIRGRPIYTSLQTHIGIQVYYSLLVRQEYHFDISGNTLWRWIEATFVLNYFRNSNPTFLKLKKSDNKLLLEKRARKGTREPISEAS